ncbi:putative ATP-grasp-modified RiPP [Embleya sp. NPDC059237]|uniref:putative ATP-grasp-modified RiPP n=1 Tax=unclassified Embleya TaxID=2699296 RepID=UPI00367E45A4
MTETSTGTCVEAEFIEKPPTPWGVRRMEPFPPAEVVPYTRVVLDADTQTGRWLTAEGAEVPLMDRHKRTETSRETKTKTSLDGNSDQGSDQEGDTD